MIVIKNADELAGMRLAGKITATVCDRLARSIFPGITTRDIDDYAGRLIAENGGRSAFLGYRGFPGTVCVSVNEEVVHGVPGKRRIQVGDVVSIDVGVIVDGFVGDMATTVAVGAGNADVMRLLSVAESALKSGIAKACAGGRVSDISHAVEMTARSAGFSVVREFVGHGIGRKMHEDPQVPNYGAPGKGPKLRAGMTLAIEPMLNMGCADVEVLGDGWTVVTHDRLPSAHFEHTVAVGDSGAEILTKLNYDV